MPREHENDQARCPVVSGAAAWYGIPIRRTARGRRRMSATENHADKRSRSIVIAVDGPAAAGKGTLARGLARRLGYAYLDTGLLYRAVGHKAAASGDPVTAATSLRPADLAAAELRGDAAAAAASLVAADPAVRSALLDFQRRFATDPPSGAPGAVLDGRDIGTIVCPRADVKLFITAAVGIRAERRLKELRERGVEAIHSRVLRDMQERDRRDSERAVAPLEPAKDATVIDTSDLSPDAVLAEALTIVDAAIRRR